MNTIYRLLFLGIFGVIFGCKSVTKSIFNNQSTHLVNIGTIGYKDASVFKNTMHRVGFITLSSPIKLEATASMFTNKTYNNFLEAKQVQSSNLNINYADSLKHQPKYLKIKIVDVLDLIEQLHDPGNENVKDYLETNQRAGVIMELSLAFPNRITDEILKAETLLLTHFSKTTYQLQLTSKNGEVSQISFKDGVVIDYKLSTPCWKSSLQNSFKIVELIGSGDKCATGAYRSPRFVKKEEDYFKF